MPSTRPLAPPSDDSAASSASGDEHDAPAGALEPVVEPASPRRFGHGAGHALSVVMGATRSVYGKLVSRLGLMQRLVLQMVESVVTIILLARVH